jgi:hypothetical protein
MTNQEIKMSPCPVCSYRLSVEATACVKCGHHITAETKNSMIQVEEERQRILREAKEARDKEWEELERKSKERREITARHAEHQTHVGGCSECHTVKFRNERWEHELHHGALYEPGCPFCESRKRNPYRPGPGATNIGR